MMAVQNFLDEEDYDGDYEPEDGSEEFDGELEDQDDSVPDFLQDEDYEDLYEPDGGDEYYGGGFSEGAEISRSVGAAESFGGIGGDPELEASDELEATDGAVDGIESATGEWVDDTTAPGSSTTTGDDTDSTDVNTTVDGGGHAPTHGSTVPDFLADEEDDYAPAVATDVYSPVAEPSRRERRDLSKPRPKSNSEADRSSLTTGGIDSRSGAAPVEPTVVPREVPTTDGERSTVATTRVSFPTASKPTPISAEEAEVLKAPSSYAENRELKYTALRQKDTTVRRVGEDGRTSGERRRAASLELPDRIPSNGKLSKEEILFYANLGAQRSADFGALSKKELFRAPVLGESPDQKREREARINRALAGGSIAAGKKTRLTEKDYRVLQFIALFKFVSERQIGKLLQVGEHAAYKRLNNLRKHGLTKSFKILGVKGSVWVLTETGMDLSGYDLPRGTEAALTLSMVSHQFTVNHVAAHLWAGGANVLREKNFPQRNLPDGKGGFDFGDQLISELQIQSAFGKLRGTTKADAYVPQIKKHMANLFDDWQRAGGAGYGPSPELQRGNEHMWTLFPPISNRLNYHVPDLVVARPRSADGKPQSIAVEIELRTKADDSSYERTLDAYRADDRIYKKVIWICRLKGTAEKLTRIATRNGLADQGRFGLVPIYLEDGSRFTGKDTWSL